MLVLLFERWAGISVKMISGCSNLRCIKWIVITIHRSKSFCNHIKKISGGECLEITIICKCVCCHSECFANYFLKMSSLSLCSVFKQFMFTILKFELHILKYLLVLYLNICNTLAFLGERCLTSAEDFFLSMW